MLHVLLVPNPDLRGALATTSSMLQLEEIADALLKRYALPDLADLGWTWAKPPPPFEGPPFEGGSGSFGTGHEDKDPKDRKRGRGWRRRKAKQKEARAAAAEAAAAGAGDAAVGCGDPKGDPAAELALLDAQLAELRAAPAQLEWRARRERCESGGEWPGISEKSWYRRHR